MLSLPGARVHSQVEKLRSHKLRSVAKRKKNDKEKDNFMLREFYIKIKKSRG